MKRIHVVGVSPRTGTTLMTEALKTCFEIDYSTDHEDHLYTRAPGQPDIFLSKLPSGIMRVGPSLKVDPNLYVICLIRDPRDIICSKHNKDPNRYWAGLKFWNTFVPELKKMSSHPRFIPIKYEDFVTDPDSTQQQIAEQIPFLKQLAPFSEYHNVAKVTDKSMEALRSVRPIKPTSVGRWRKHKARIAGQIQQHGSISEDLIAFGYEKDNRWLNELNDVEPDLTPSSYPEFMTFKDRRMLTLGRYIEAARRVFEQLIGRRLRITHPKKWF